MGRIVGIDIARGLALIGMFISHVAPDGAMNGQEPSWTDFPDERARLLFAVTAGLGLGLLSGGARRNGHASRDHPRSEIRRAVAIRALVLIALGYLLAGTGARAAIILDEYGAAFLLMLPLLFLPIRWLFASGAVLVAVAPGLVSALADQPSLPRSPGQPWNLYTEWFITGPYPVLTWLAVFLLGVAVTRLGLHRPPVVMITGLAALIAMVGGWAMSMAMGGTGIRESPETGDLLVDAIGRSLFTIGNIGFCFAVTMVLIALTTPLPDRSAGFTQGVARLLSPVAAMGSMPLTVYSAHLIVMVFAIEATPTGLRTDTSWALLIWLTVGALVISWVWRRRWGRGPIERLVTLASSPVARSDFAR